MLWFLVAFCAATAVASDVYSLTLDASGNSASDVIISVPDGYHFFLTLELTSNLSFPANDYVTLAVQNPSRSFTGVTMRNAEAVCVPTCITNVCPAATDPGSVSPECLAFCETACEGIKSAVGVCSEVSGNYVVSAFGTPNATYTLTSDLTQATVGENALTGRVGGTWIRTFEFEVTELHQPYFVEVTGGRDFNLTSGEILYEYHSYDEIALPQPNSKEEFVSGILMVRKATEGCPKLADAYQNSETSLRLNFADQGRIILSSASTPPLSLGKWYATVTVDAYQAGGFSLKAAKEFNIRVYKDTYHYNWGLPTLFFILTSFAVPLAFLLALHFVTGIWDTGTIYFTRWATPQELWVVVWDDWFLKSHKTFPYWTAVVAIVFGTASFQVVYEQWQSVKLTGDLNTCFYNELCYRSGQTVNMPINNIISNTGYIIGGFLLLIHFAVWQAKVPKQDNVVYNFSLPYAICWGLVTEGLFSAFYHICPSRLIFQFDTAFMFVITSLLTVALFQPVISNETASSNIPPVSASAYYLWFIAPLYFLNYIGSIYNERNNADLTTGQQVVFFIALLSWEIWVFVIFFFRHKEYLLNTNLGELLLGPAQLLSAMMTKCGIVPNSPRIAWLYWTMLPVVIAMTSYVLATHADIATFFLGLLIVLALIMTFIKLQHWWPLHNWRAKTFLAILSMITGGIWVVALYYFVNLSVTEKTQPPEVSRALNAACIQWDFFDAHDVWHQLSGYGLVLLLLLICQLNPPVAIRLAPAIDPETAGTAMTDMGPRKSRIDIERLELAAASKLRDEEEKRRQEERMQAKQRKEEEESQRKDEREEREREKAKAQAEAKRHKEEEEDKRRADEIERAKEGH